MSKVKTYNQWLREYKQKLKENKPEENKDEKFRKIYISTVRRYLTEHRIKYTEYNSLTTNSVYFHIEEEDSHPCIRVSDHADPNKRIYLCEFVYTLVSKKQTKEGAVKLIYRSLDNGFRRSRTSKYIKAMEKLWLEK